MANLSTKLPWELANPLWAATLNPVVSNPILQGNMLKNIVLTANIPKAINHLLQRMPLGWMMIDINADAVIWRTQPLNENTITLEANADATISIWVF